MIATGATSQARERRHGRLRPCTGREKLEPGLTSAL